MEDLGSPCPDVAMEDPESALLQAAMDAPFTASLGPMGPLLRQLHSRPKGVDDDKIQLLKDDLVGLCISLKKVSEAAGASFMAKWWMKEVRELCYDTQDYLDEAFLKHSGAGARRSARLISFRVGGKLEWRPQIGKKGQGRCGASRLQQTSTTRRNLKRRPQKAAISFSELMARVEVLGDVGERFELGVEAIKSDSAQVGVSRLTPHRSLRHRLHSDSGGLSLVGVEEPVNKLVNMLALDDDSQKQVKVVSIFGFAGVGKTTAATTLYRNFRGKFQCRAFVRVSRTPDMMGILTSILSQIKASQVHGFPDAQDLIDNIREHLQGKRYFIIIDDLWTTSVWNIISRAFPDSDCCSRIVTTSETEDISLACCSYNLTYMFHMCPLNDGQSRKLFFTRVFGSESGCPPEFREVSYGIITKCGGSPFTTVIVASMLASEPNLAMEQWKSIHDSLSSIVGTNPTSEGTKEVLNLIYNYLPPHLKTCLLHLGVYPEGYTIRKHDLVKQWVAEGFLGTMEEVQNMEKIAGVYFDELVSRGMVQAVDTNYGGEVLSCTIHQMVLDFIRDKSMEENFAITVDYFQSTLALPDKVRRLSIQFGGAKSAKIPEGFIISHVRSLLFFGFFKCVPLTLGYGLLRVLILHMWANEDKIIDLSRISELSRLTYLKIKCNSTIELPAKIGGIQDLGTLEVDARLSAVPSDIVHLENLLHLRLPSESCMPREVGHMTCLRTLGYFDIGRNSEENVMNLGKLTNLQDLQLTCSTVQTAQNLEKNLHLLGSILEKLSILQSVTLVPTADSNANTLKDHAGTSSMSIFCDSLSSVSFAPSLERIELLPRFCIFPTLPKWFEQLGKLRTLKIAVRELCGEDICILKALPALTALSLYVQTAPAEIITFDKTGFLLLSYLKFRCTTPSLKFESDAMPNLLKLKLSFMAPYRVEQYATATISIEHLSCLKEISTKIRGAGAISIEHLPSGKQISTQMRSEGSAPEWATIINHKNNPTINVQLVGCFFNGNPGMETQGKDEVEHEKEEPKPNDMRTLTQPLSSSDLLTPDFNIQKLELEVKVRWLKPREVLNILQKHQLFTVERRTPQKPPSGSWFLFNRRVHRFFRNDGYEWRKKKNGKTIAEAHEYLKVDNLEALNCYYAHVEKNPTFQRRIYWMLEPAYEHIVLVHYRDVLEGSLSVPEPKNSSASTHDARRADARRSPGLNSKLSLENKEDRDANTEEILPTHGPFILPGIQNTRTFLADILSELESSEDNSKDANTSSSSEMSSISDRIPGSPFQVPAIPSRFSLSAPPSRNDPLNLSLEKVIKLTHNFSPDLMIGESYFGKAYRAELQDGHLVAIKRARKEHFVYLHAEFENEIALLKKIEHRNLVQVLSYIHKGDERIVITEFVSNCNLRDHLDGQHGLILGFSQRLQIAIDVAHGLTYLHLYPEKPIIHRDVKSSNILLDEGFRAKVADFGFARTGPSEQPEIQTDVKGTAGYVDPEYLRTNYLTVKSDVYSYGTLLLEILSGRRPIEVKRGTIEKVTVQWAFEKYNRGGLQDILDPMLTESVNEDILTRIFDVTFQCIAPTRAGRPHMKEVVEKLLKIKRDYTETQSRAEATI